MNLRAYLSRRASIGNWLFLLMVLCILLQFVFLRLEVDSYNSVQKIAQDQQSLIEMQQKIIESVVVPPNSEVLHFDPLVH
jgi:membrane protein insertase Oxa1/YidC/SpoIIIJ